MSSTRTLKTVTLFGIAILTTSLAHAHHGAVTQSSLYLTDDFVELEGEIVEVLWRNPHTRARMLVIGDDGEEQMWEIELSPGPRALEGRGIYEQDLLGPARAAGYVSRRDADSLGALHILLPDGREYAPGNRELLWAGERVQLARFVVDSEREATERRTASGIFRTWGRRLRGRPAPADYQHLLTERGREVAAQFYAPRDNPELECRTGVGASMMDPMPLEIIDEGDHIVVHQSEYNLRRTIWLDPEASGAEPEPGPYGFSVGRWEDDVLIVNTSLIDFPYLDPYGTPQTDQTEYLEHFQLDESGDEVRLDYSLTATDPVMYAEPIVFARQREWSPGRVFEEFNCTHEWEGER